MTEPSRRVLLVSGDEIARYGFGDGHPFGNDRHEAFMRELHQCGMDGRVQRASARPATREELEWFHSAAYVDLVRDRSVTGHGYLDAGDTPAFRGVFEAASHVVGGTLTAVEAVMSGKARRAFIPIAGLHHAAPERAAGFCVFNDCGIAVHYLRQRHQLKRIAYVDIDAHHGDGVFYAFEDDPDLLFADMHEDGRYLYPGTGHANETGAGQARGTKLNIPLPPGADDDEYHQAWARIEEYLLAGRPEFILLNVARTAWTGTRSPTCASASRRMRTRRPACAPSPTSSATAASSPWAAGATTAATWPGPGPGWSSPSWTARSSRKRPTGKRPEFRRPSIAVRLGRIV